MLLDWEGRRSLLPSPFDLLQILRYGSRVLFPHSVLLRRAWQGTSLSNGTCAAALCFFWESGVTLEKKSGEGKLLISSCHVIGKSPGYQDLEI